MFGPKTLRPGDFLNRGTAQNFRRHMYVRFSSLIAICPRSPWNCSLSARRTVHMNHYLKLGLWVTQYNNVVNNAIRVILIGERLNINFQI